MRIAQIPFKSVVEQTPELIIQQISQIWLFLFLTILKKLFGILKNFLNIIRIQYNVYRTDETDLTTVWPQDQNILPRIFM